jgi:hypothetical protein
MVKGYSNPFGLVVPVPRIISAADLRPNSAKMSRNSFASIHGPPHVAQALPWRMMYWSVGSIDVVQCGQIIIEVSPRTPLLIKPSC